MNIFRHLIPKSLAGQLIALLLIALIGGQLVAFGIFSDERREAIEDTTRGQILKRTATLVRLLEATPRELHGRIVTSASTRLLIFSLDDVPSTAAPPTTYREKLMARHLRDELGLLAQDIRIYSKVQRYAEKWRRWYGHDDDTRDDHRYGHRRHFQNLDLTLAIKTSNSVWLNAKTEVGAHGPAWALQSLIALFVTGLSIIGAVILVVRRITRPLRSLTAAAEKFGRGETQGDIVSEGPDDVRRSIEAFNKMRHRLERYIEDRTNMLAAVSHDLKTPITALRIRTEFIKDADLKEAFIRTLDEMQAITESTLNFAREDADRSDTRPTDITALLDSMCQDFENLGHTINFSPPDRLVLPCRPSSLKRALNNVLDNAIVYGGRADLELIYDPGAEQVTITIEDGGPGIPDGDLERVFQPFVRLEGSRNRETGGSGLGLAIAPSIIRGHGGEIKLENSAGGGLRAIIQLPVPPTVAG